MRVAAAARSGGQRLLALCAVVSMLLSLMAIGAGPALGDEPASGPDTITVDGVTYQVTQKSGPVSHFETPDTNPTTASTSRNVWEGHGSEHLPCENGIHWVDNTELLTISNCLEGEGEPEPEPEPELDLARATVVGACVEGSFVVNVSAVNATVGVDLDGSGTIEGSAETALTSGSHAVTAAVGVFITFEATADVGAEFDGAAPSGRIRVLDCAPEQEPEVGSIVVTKTADQSTVVAPGGPVTFTVEVENTSNLEVVVTMINDNHFGNIADSRDVAVSPDVISTTCEMPQTLAPDDGVDGSGDDYYSCEFTAEVTGDPGDTHNNVVLVCGVDENGNKVEDRDRESVDVVAPAEETGTLQVKKEATDDTELEFTFTGPDGTFTLKHGESFFFEAELGVEFTFTEILPEGWRLEDIDCDDPDGTAVIDLENNSVTMVVTDPGSPFKCNFDNEEGVFEQPDTGTLQIKKHSDDDVEAEFTFTGPDGEFTLSDNESFFFEAELGVEHTFTEIVLEGWRLESIECDTEGGTAVIDLENNSVTMVVTDPGSPFKCEFDNEQLPVPEEEVGNIVIVKEVAEGSDQETEFTFEATGFALADATLAHGEQISVEVNAGVFSVAELSAEGWELVSAVCESTDEGDESTPGAISVSADETVTCTFTNVEVEVSPEVLPEIAVTKTADTAAAEVGDTVTFIVVISNPSATEPVKISSIVDSVFGTLSGDADCMVDVTLAAGASCEFSFTWTVTEADIGTHENVVEVIGIDVEKPEVTVRAEARAVVDVSEVGGIVITPPEQPGPITPVDRPDVAPDIEVEAEQLPFTGIETDRLIGLAVLLLGAGVLLLKWTPPREVDIIIIED